MILSKSCKNRHPFSEYAYCFMPFFPQDNEELKTTIAPGSKSLLPTSIQELIKMIFDVESMKKTLVEFEVSEKVMANNFLTILLQEVCKSTVRFGLKLILVDNGKSCLVYQAIVLCETYKLSSVPVVMYR